MRHQKIAEFEWQFISFGSYLYLSSWFKPAIILGCEAAVIRDDQIPVKSV